MLFIIERTDVIPSKIVEEENLEETEEILAKANIDPTIRAEKLDIESILKLSDVYFKLKQES